MMYFKLTLSTIFLATTCLSACGAPLSDSTSKENSTPKPVAQAVQAEVPNVTTGWISVKTYGEGPDVILIPGLASSATVWDGTIAALKDTHRLHVVQVAGFAGAAKSEIVRKGIIKGLTDDLSAYINSENLETPFIVGHSLGGFTALNMARDYPEQISQVVIVDSLPFYSVIFNPAGTVETTIPYAQQMIKQMAEMPKPDYDKAQKRNARIFSKKADVQKRIGEWGAASDRDVVLNAMYELMTTDLRLDLPSISTPVSVVYAHDTQMGMPAAAMTSLYESQYSGLSDVTLTRIDGSYHFIMDDQPEAFYTALKVSLETEK